MFVDPIIVLGAPRSGTSLMQKLLREHPGHWSLASESDEIWNRFCHPKLRGWDSDAISADALNESDRARILAAFEMQVQEAAFWREAIGDSSVWTMSGPMLQLRRALRPAYYAALRVKHALRTLPPEMRLVEKTISTPFRLGYVSRVFDNAKFVHISRSGPDAIASIMDCWLNPDRFFSYRIPVELNIAGYSYDRWNFALPPGWRDYTNARLEEVCAFQWIASNAAILDYFADPAQSEAVLHVKLEHLIADPAEQLRHIADHLQLTDSGYLAACADSLPKINARNASNESDTWKTGPHADAIASVLPMIEPTMNRLGYDIDA